MKIKSWSKVGKAYILAEKYKRMLVSQKFINPISGVLEEYSFFAGKVESVIIFPITKDKKVVATKQFRHAANDVFIEIPGGNKNPKESFENTARRELLEETGFSAEKFINLKTKKIWIDPGGVKNYHTLCLATGCHKVSEPKLDVAEQIEVVTIPIIKWLEMIHEGLIIDCKTVAMTFLVLPYIGINLKK